MDLWYHFEESYCHTYKYYWSLQLFGPRQSSFSHHQYHVLSSGIYNWNSIQNERLLREEITKGLFLHISVSWSCLGWVLINGLTSSKRAQVVAKNDEETDEASALSLGLERCGSCDITRLIWARIAAFVKAEVRRNPVFQKEEEEASTTSLRNVWNVES